MDFSLTLTTSGVLGKVNQSRLQGKIKTKEILAKKNRNTLAQSRKVEAIKVKAGLSRLVGSLLIAELCDSSRN